MVKNARNDNKITLDTLGGFAISCVLLNHFIHAFVSNRHGGYANGIIAIFFIISGYKLYFSFNDNTKLSFFYLKRALRIYPLYILALTAYSIMFNVDIPLRVYLGSPFHCAPVIYYFITFILQCYILSPLFYYSLKKMGLEKYIFAITLLTLFTFLATSPLDVFSNDHSYDYFAYRRMFLGHLTLFSLGMAIPEIIKTYPTFNKGRLWGIFSFFLFIFFVYITKIIRVHFCLPFLLTSLYFCLVVLSNNYFQRKNVFSYLGKYSFSIYLFHYPFFKILHVLEREGVFQYVSILSIVYTLLLLPVFLLVCVLLEKTQSYIQHKIGKVITTSKTFSSSDS